MNNAEYSFTLDLQSVQSQITLEVNSGDTARRLLIVLTNGGKTHKLAEGSMAVLSAKKSNGKYLFNKCSIVNDNTTIRYDFTAATTDTPGIMQCELLIADPTEKTIISPRFTLIVDNLINGDEVISEDENLFLTQAVAQELARENNEKQREDAENARKSAEDIRQSKEIFRQEFYRKIESRVANLEKSAEGSLYETVTEGGVVERIQVKNALPYGIISFANEGVQCRMGMPYDLRNATAGLESGTAVTVLSANSIKLPKGSLYLAFIPVSISEGTRLTLSYKGENKSGDKVAKYGLFSKRSSSGLIGSTMASGSETVAEADASYIGIYHTRTSGGSALLEDLVVEDILLQIKDEVYLIATGLYDEGVATVSEDGVIELKPNAVLSFETDGVPLLTEVELNYKNKRTVN